MIFKPDLVKLIHQGKKRQTRRPVGRSCRYQVGKVYAVQPGRGRQAVSHITVTEVREEALGDLSLPDARREGFRTTAEFVEYWVGLYGSYDPAQRVWVLSFVQGDVTDRPRMLAARPGGPQGDYTDNPARAVRGEPEAIPAKLQERYATDGRERSRDAQREKYREQRKRLLAAVAEIREHAVDRGVDEKLRAIERQIVSLDSKLRSAV